MTVCGIQSGDAGGSEWLALIRHTGLDPVSHWAAPWRLRSGRFWIKFRMTVCGIQGGDAGGSGWLALIRHTGPRAGISLGGTLAAS